jgi:hypothetical protein
MTISWPEAAQEAPLSTYGDCSSIWRLTKIEINCLFQTGNSLLPL